MRKLLSWFRGSPAVAKPTAPCPETELGKVLIRMHAVGEQVLERALAEQERTGERLGAVLVRMKAITEEKLQLALSFQERMRKGDKGGVMVDIVQHRTTRALSNVAQPVSEPPLPLAAAAGRR